MIDIRSPNRDIIECLERIGEDIEIAEAVNGPDDESIMPLRQTETLIRRLAREAGYVIPGVI